jgi:hypothetical protein
MANNIDWTLPSIGKWLSDNAKSYGDGQYSVYYWADRTGRIFYVGMGKGYRFSDTNPKARSAAFIEKYNEGGCYCKIVAFGMDERKARDLERSVIEGLFDVGCGLINRQFVDPTMYRTPACVEARKRLHNSMLGRKRISDDASCDVSAN